MGFFSRIFKKRKIVDESEYLKTDEEMRHEKEAKQITNQQNVPPVISGYNKVSKKSINNSKQNDTNHKTYDSKISDDEKETTKNIQEDKVDDEEISNDESSTTVNLKGVSGLFEIKKSKDGRYVFNLYASNHVIVATSQIYSSSQSALIGINSVITNAEKANIEDQTIEDFAVLGFPKWEIYKDKADHFRFRLRATNGSCVCHSQGYTTKHNCKNGIESIIKNCKNSKIDKSYLKK